MRMTKNWIKKKTLDIDSVTADLSLICLSVNYKLPKLKWAFQIICCLPSVCMSIHQSLHKYREEEIQLCSDALLQNGDTVVTFFEGRKIYIPVQVEIAIS